MPISEPTAAARVRRPIERIGATVLREFVQAIVSGEYAAGQILPTEAELTTEFGVSRTVIRETMKRLQEKGMITVAQGRGTHVQPITSWNVLDPLVLSTMIGNDRTLGVLDDLSVVRSALEAEMAGDVAGSVDEQARVLLRERIDDMAESVADSSVFREADVQFHLAVMDLSGNALAANIARALILHAVHSDRYLGLDPTHAFELTLAEHQAVVDAIDAGDQARAREAMREHILGSWQRRRLPTDRSSS
ncbi:FadR family transcriptional regulator [Ruania alkalisoli]|uniref:FadR family transcriptional regulator n=1 Tax=Ruania alkalisoli TaxID=2779775 RepID=A0A7M1SSE1_9MICO|nr:FadR/GntR family transcriptional regulator [Ruania alkalisoli]QOR70405.1 FadR family transcriptional regulator [Ruania alkalisoli]